MIDRRTIWQAVRRLLDAAPEGSRVIVFGSYARGDARPDSDLDLMVVEPEVRGRIRETARLDRALSGMRIPLDLLVVSEETFAQWKDTPNTVIHEAAREGEVFREVA